MVFTNDESDGIIFKSQKTSLSPTEKKLFSVSKQLSLTKEEKL